MYLSEKLHTKVVIGNVQIDFFRKIILENLYIEDLHHDTLLYARKIKVGIGEISLKKQKIYIRDIILLNTKAKLIKYKQEENLNFQFIIDAFTSADTVTKTKSPWSIRFKEVSLINTDFTFKNEHDTIATSGINYTDLYVKKINGKFTEINLIKDSILAKINYFTAVEKSGFELLSLSTNVHISPIGIILNHLKLATPKSTISTDLSFTYSNYNALNDFIDSVKINAEFNHSHLELNDISYFSPELKGLYKNITISGKISGKISDLKGKKMQLQLADNTDFVGDIALTGLPNIEETFIYLNVIKLTTNYTDLIQFPIPPFIDHKKLDIPSNIAKLGTIKFKGTFTGLYNDFYAYGNLSTALGNVYSDLSVRHDFNKNNELYKGKLKSTNFNFGNFFDAKLLGKVTMDVDVDGSGLTLEDVNAQLKGIINSIDFNDYSYQNVAIEGNIAKKIFNGKLNVKDDNIDFDFMGTVDIRNKLPKLDFVATLNSANLTKLHFVNTAQEAILSTKLNINITGDNIDDFMGQINLKNTIYKQGIETFKLGTFHLVSEEKNGLKSITLSSDLADANITGNFKLLQMPGEVGNIIHTYLPSIFRKTDSKKRVYENFSYDVQFKTSTAFTRLFLPGIVIAPKTKLRGSIASDNNQLEINGNSSAIDIYGLRLKNWKISAKSEKSDFQLTTSCDHLFLTDSIELTDFSISSIIHMDSINLAMNWDNKTQKKLNKGNIKSFVYFAPNKKIEYKIMPSQFILSDTVWSINNTSRLVIDSTTIAVQDLVFEHGNQSLSLNGIISNNKTDQLKLNINNFNLANLNGLMKPFGVSLKGTINGASTITDAYHETVLATDLDFKSLGVNDTIIGNGTIKTVWDNTSEAVSLRGSFSKKNIPNILFSGFYYPTKTENNLAIEFNLQAIQMQLLKPFVHEYCSEFDGLISGKVNVTGSLQKPLLSGLINVKADRVKVDYLNTVYRFTHDITIENNLFDIENMTIYDANNNTAIVNGKVYHTNFKKFQLDFDIQTNKFMCLNTTEISNNGYYGKAFATGMINIFGFTDNVLIDANVKTEKITSNNKADKTNLLSKTDFTRIYIPLGGISEVSQNNFITFIKKENAINHNKYDVQLGGLILNFDIDVTPDAEIQLIFDQKVGDIIKARGNGDIKLTVNPQGDLKMYGDYIIENGDYLFTLQNIINKKFAIEKGSVIKWSGIPYKADLDINAIYKARASLSPFFDSTNTAIDRKKRYPIDLKLNMTGDLLSPTINFDIGIPTVDAETRQTVSSYINNETEVNRQVFSLLILNSFVTPYQLENGSTGVPDVGGVAGTNTSELLSNQLSNMLSKISKDFDIGVNYRPGDAISKEELAVALSTQLFNDKLSIEGNVGNKPHSEATNNIVGDVTIDYKITDDGKVRIKAFNKSNDNNQTNSNGAYTQGVGVFYREEFNTIGQLYKRYLETIRGWKNNSKKK